MEEVFRFIRQVADSPKTSVLIHGETGTGKELVARAIHYNSSRADKPFIEVNCSAFQETLLESELFGYESGAFTGATHRKKGLLEMAHGGSFFLDEIGEMSMSLQSKLLKVIEEQTFRRIGGTKEIKIDTRIFSATSRNLIKEVEENRFRKDLFYRLNVARIELPPLRDRGEDVLLLTDHFIKQYNLEFKRNIQGIRKEVKDALLTHTWPGNVRELRNVIERAVLFEKGKYLSVSSIGFIENTGKNQKNHSYRTEKLDVIKFDMEQNEPLLPSVERELILKVLKYYRFNLTQAARVLGISRGSFRYKVRKLNINVDRDMKE
jgi:transcriptional regulator with PAS, ATPase and Fis domain